MLAPILKASPSPFILELPEDGAVNEAKEVSLTPLTYSFILSAVVEFDQSLTITIW